MTILHHLIQFESIFNHFRPFLMSTLSKIKGNFKITTKVLMSNHYYKDIQKTKKTVFFFLGFLWKHLKQILLMEGPALLGYPINNKLCDAPQQNLGTSRTGLLWDKDNWSWHKSENYLTHLPILRFLVFQHTLVCFPTPPHNFWPLLEDSHKIFWICCSLSYLKLV